MSLFFRVSVQYGNNTVLFKIYFMLRAGHVAACHSLPSLSEYGRLFLTLQFPFPVCVLLHVYP